MTTPLERQLADALRGMEGLVQLMLAGHSEDKEWVSCVNENHRLITAREVLAAFDASASDQQDVLSPLLPCPFCGGIAKIVRWTKRGGDDHYTANCTSCDATATDESDRDEAMASWNSRAAPTIDKGPLVELVEKWANAAERLGQRETRDGAPAFQAFDICADELRAVIQKMFP